MDRGGRGTHREEIHGLSTDGKSKEGVRRTREGETDGEKTKHTQ